MIRCEAMQTDYHKRVRAALQRKESWVDFIKVQLRKLFAGLGREDDFDQFVEIGQSIANSLMCP